MRYARRRGRLVVVRLSFLFGGTLVVPLFAFILLRERTFNSKNSIFLCVVLQFCLILLLPPRAPGASNQGSRSNQDKYFRFLPLMHLDFFTTTFCTHIPMMSSCLCCFIGNSLHSVEIRGG